MHNGDYIKPMGIKVDNIIYKRLIMKKMIVSRELDSPRQQQIKGEKASNDVRKTIFSIKK